MKSLVPLMVITFKEGIRNRAIFGIFLLALSLFAANFLICGMIMQEVGKVAVDVALSAVSFSGLLLVLFVGINLLAKDLDRRTIYMVLARPISRAQYIWGKFLGMALLIIVSVSFLGGGALLSIASVKWAYPSYFSRFAWGGILWALALIALMLILLSALSFLFASFASSSFVTLILTVISYFIGHGVAAIKVLVEAPQTVGIEVSATTVRLVETAYYLFPNLSVFDIKIQAAHNLPLSLMYMFWIVVYGIIYSGLAVTVAGFIFSRREFP
ncbi:membrane protein, putative [Syntrophotalea carbinolica DSM 2380]|uniref:Membrane protein, putative n=1 Tax=Syntrophotalea carbinolica (strain DSM 2380 / NBRC 103641 / GraBd1) TaxID=338963 RepID=Q3A2M7_SYNC1|nr:ABC transporter permease subunit [Syntrophotalea carbinolica]ABA89380.1 membrane protein, putative [Syntrophotalea carbinolica DSM 2380]